MAAVTSMRSAAKPRECDSLAMKLKRGKIPKQTHGRSKVSALRHGRKRPVQGLCSGASKNFLPGVLTCQNKYKNIYIFLNFMKCGLVILYYIKLISGGPRWHSG